METTQKAYAKLNLGLDVTGRRADGYHLVDMIMQTVDLFDTLTVRCLPEKTTDAVTLRIAAEDERKTGQLSAGEDNLVVRAIRAMQQKYQLHCGFEAELVKRIPMAAGMAGGSADAAAALRCVRALCVPFVSDKELEQLAVTLGADVPYCITGGTKRCEGIGEILTDLRPAPQCGVVILKPPAGVSTPWIYRALDASPIERHPNIPAMIRADEAGDLRQMMEEGIAWNVLEPVALRSFPEISVAEDTLLLTAESTGAGRKLIRVMMTGSGPTCFALFETMQQAESVFLRLKQNAMLSEWDIFCTGFIDTRQIAQTQA